MLRQVDALNARLRSDDAAVVAAVVAELDGVFQDYVKAVAARRRGRILIFLDYMAAGGNLDAMAGLLSSPDAGLQAAALAALRAYAMIPDAAAAGGASPRLVAAALPLMQRSSPEALRAGAAALVADLIVGQMNGYEGNDEVDALVAQVRGCAPAAATRQRCRPHTPLCLVAALAHTPRSDG
jgi:hypothetical protein